MPFLAENFLAPSSHRFMQDNNLKHYSCMAQKFYDDFGINWWRTPPDLPDLNLIKNLWHELKEYFNHIKTGSHRKCIATIDTIIITHVYIQLSLLKWCLK